MPAFVVSISMWLVKRLEHQRPPPANGSRLGCKFDSLNRSDGKWCAKTERRVKNKAPTDGGLGRRVARRRRLTGISIAQPIDISADALSARKGWAGFGGGSWSVRSG